jgi:uncharacterized repeat protein (TIGR02543 family)
MKRSDFMKKATTYLLILVLLCASMPPATAAAIPGFTNEIAGVVDSGIRFEGQDTLAVAWAVRPSKPGFTLTNTQGVRLAYDNTVLRLIRWDAGSAFADSGIGLSFALMPGASHIGDFETNTAQVWAARNSSGATGFLSLAAGDDATFHTAAQSMSLMGIRFAFRAGKSAADLAPGSIRLMNAAELNATSQYCGALINAFADGSPDTFLSYEYLRQKDGVAAGGDALEPPAVTFPGSEGDSLTFTVGSATARSGGRVSIPVEIANNPGISSAAIRIAIGADLEWDYDPAAYGANSSTWPFSVGGVLPITGRPQGNNLTATSMTLNFSDMSSGENVYGNGTLVTLKLRVKDNAGEGGVPVAITVNKVIDEVETAVPFRTVDGTISVRDVIYGDVNGDGDVDIADLQRLAQWLNGWNVAINASNGDANADGGVDIVDLQRLAQWLNGWSVALGPTAAPYGTLAVRAMGAPEAGESEFSFAVGSVPAEPGGQITVPIRVSNNPGFSAATVKITIDPKLEWGYDPANYTNNASTWPFAAGAVLPVTGRPQGNNLTPTSMTLNFSDLSSGENVYDDGTLVTLKLKVAEGAAGSLPITLEVVKCIDENETVMTVASVAGMVNLPVIIPIAVTFNADNGTENTVAAVNPGEKAAKPENPVKDGYDFIAWFDGDAEFDFDAPITGDLTLTAKWKAKPIRGDIDGDGAITMGDMIILMDCLSGIRTLTPEELLAADIDGDGAPTMGDLIILMDYLSGVRAEL